MKCNYCGTTIPEGNKICNGCGKKVTMFTKFQQPYNEESNDQIKEIEELTEEEIDYFMESPESQSARLNLKIEGFEIKDKNAKTAFILSIIGVMFMSFGIIFNIIALNKAKQITNPMEKEKILKVVKIMLAVSAFMFLFTLLPIIFSI
ncbi:MAG: zinc ribbon domain-containing protein [Lactobacillales bacterium]|nr:zinc ribbon domain-containing protein [Lactobacillales bacterium]